MQTTNPYYRTTYAMVFKPGYDLDDVTSLEDQHACRASMSASSRARRRRPRWSRDGLMTIAKPYPLVDTRVGSRPRRCRRSEIGRDRRRCAVGADGRLLCAAGEPHLPVVPLVKEPRAEGVLSYRDGGARGGSGVAASAEPADRGEPGEIDQILLDFGVPLLDEGNHLITAEAAAASP